MAHHQKERKREAMSRVSLVQDILRQWDPIGTLPGEAGPADEYDAYAPHIVSLVDRGCSPEELVEHLGDIRVGRIGVEANPDGDLKAARDILTAIR